jgi:hypothetical protein
MKFFAPACVGFGAVADRARFGVGEVGVVNAGASPCALCANCEGCGAGAFALAFEPAFSASPSDSEVPPPLLDIICVNSSDIAANATASRRPRLAERCGER